MPLLAFDILCFASRKDLSTLQISLKNSGILFFTYNAGASQVTHISRHREYTLESTQIIHAHKHYLGLARFVQASVDIQHTLNIDKSIPLVHAFMSYWRFRRWRQLSLVGNWTKIFDVEGADNARELVYKGLETVQEFALQPSFAMRINALLRAEIEWLDTLERIIGMKSLVNSLEKEKAGSTHPEDARCSVSSQFST